MNSPFSVYILKLTTYDVEKRERERERERADKKAPALSNSAFLSAPVVQPEPVCAPGLSLRLATLLKNKQEKNQNGRLY